jgi:hypothetical protein
MSHLRDRLTIALSMGPDAIASAIRQARRERILGHEDLVDVHGYHKHWIRHRELGIVRTSADDLEVLIPTLGRFDGNLWMSTTVLGLAYLHGTWGDAFDRVRAEFGMGVGEIAALVGVGERAPHAWRYGRHPKPATARQVMQRLYAGDPRHGRWT